MEEALALLKFVKSVTIVHRRDALRASKIMQEKVLEDHKDRVGVLWETQIREVRGTDKLEEIVVENFKTGQMHKMPAEGLFLAIGHVPDTAFLSGQVGLDEKGHLVTELTQRGKISPQEAYLSGYPTMTSVSGVFGAGDVVDFRYRQAVTAAGMGCMAALDVERYLRE